MSDKPDYSHLPLLKFSHSESPFDGFIQTCESSGAKPTLMDWRRWYRASAIAALEDSLGPFEP